MQQRIHSISRNAIVCGADSKQWDVTPRMFLPGGILSIFTGKGRSLIDENEIYKNELGNWMAVKMKHNGKTIALINLYRIPATSSNGVTCSLTQYNLQEGKSRSTKHYRTDILKQIKTYIMNNNEITDILIAGDFNQNIGSDEIQRFYREIGVKDAHS